MNNDNKLILDACCGGRMMWFDKKHPNALYIDIRKEGKGFVKEHHNFEINPDIQMDFRQLQLPDNKFNLVVWDVPHLLSNHCGNGIFRKKFGCLNAETWQSDLKKGFEECWRVLKPCGILLLKWNDKSISSQKVLKNFHTKPLFGQRTTKSKFGTTTYWFCFMKLPGDVIE